MYLTALAVLALVAVAIRQRAPSRSFVAVGGLVAAQILLGAANVWLGKHAGLILAHLSLGTAIWATIVYANTTLMRDPRPPLGARHGAWHRELQARDRGGHRLMESATATRDAGAGRALRRRRAPVLPRARARLHRAHQAADHLAPPRHHRRDDGRRDARGPGALDGPVDDARRLPRRRRRRRDQPLPRPRPRRPHGAHALPPARLRADRARPRPRLRDRPGRAGVRPARAHGQPALGRPGDGGPPGLRLRLHDVAEAADAAEHRDRRRRGRGAPARRLGRGDGQPDARLALSVRDRLHVDAAPLLGALASHQGRLRADRRADDAGGARRGIHAPPDRGLRRRSWSRSRSHPSRPGLFGGIYLAAALVLGGVFLALAVKLVRSPSRPAALRLYLSSLAYLALLFTAMAIDRAL